MSERILTAEEVRTLSDCGDLSHAEAARLCDSHEALRARVAELEALLEEHRPYVCPGCHAVGEERCAPGCIDAEIEAEVERRDGLDYCPDCGALAFFGSAAAPEICPFCAEDASP